MSTANRSASRTALVAHHYSIGPRTLLALLEFKSGCDRSARRATPAYPYKGGGWELLSYQLAWVANS
jgi:hypothetical protein